MFWAALTQAQVNSHINYEVTYRQAWDAAVNELFVLDSGASPISNHETCFHNLKSLLIRQKIPLNVTAIRNSSPSYLYKLAMLAGISGITSWKRETVSSSGGKIKLTDHGYPIHPSSPTNIESDVMTSIICALLIVIATFHLMYVLNQRSENKE